MVLQLRGDLGGLTFGKTQNQKPKKSPERGLKKSMKAQVGSPVREALAKLCENISLDDAKNVVAGQAKDYTNSEAEVITVTDGSETKMVKLKMGRRIKTKPIVNEEVDIDEVEIVGVQINEVEIEEVELDEGENDEVEIEEVEIDEEDINDVDINECDVKESYIEEEKETNKTNDSPTTKTDTAQLPSSSPRLSNSLSDLVRVICRLCSATPLLTELRAHSRAEHRISLSEYTEQHGELQLVEEVQHECLLCAEVLLLDSETLARHLRRCHRAVAYKEYSVMMGVMAMAGA